MHAFTTRSEKPAEIRGDTLEIVKDWLACGIDPTRSKVVLQTEVPAIAELSWFFAMLIPFNRVMNNPTIKTEIDAKGLGDSYPFGFPLYAVGQCADILAFRPVYIPVGEDQVPHIEFTREIGRRFNHIYGKEPGYEQKAEESVKKLGGQRAKAYKELRTRYQQTGDAKALEEGRALLAQSQNLAAADRERLYGYLEGGGKMILSEPAALLTEASKMPGLDGQKMSKSYNNALAATAAETAPAMPAHPARRSVTRQRS